jgi:RND family efflux transporter MFP subunit
MNATHTTLSTKLALTVVLIGAVLSGCTRGGDETAGIDAAAAVPPPVAIRVQTPEYRSLERRISYVGTAYSRQEVPINARVQGTLAELPVTEGEFFTTGTVLARLEAPEMDAAVSRLQTEYEYWSERYATDARLVEQGALAPEQAATSARAMRTAEAGLAEAEANLAKTVITAPFDGAVLSWRAEIGQPIMPGQPILLIGDAVREVRVDVVEEDLARGIAVGTAVDLRLAPTVYLRSSVTEISPASSGPARTFSVTIPFPAQSEATDAAGGTPSPGGIPLPRKGSSVTTEFVVEQREDTLAVPQRAIADRDGTPHLFVIHDGIAHRRDITPGIDLGGWVAVDFPWNGSDTVAVTNLNGLRDGTSVYAVIVEEAR